MWAWLMKGLGMPASITKSAVTQSREVCLNRVRVFKQAITGHIDAGNRDFVELRSLVDQYADAQNAADALSGQVRVE